MLVGRDDSMIDPEEAERAARSVPGGRFARVAGAGHVAPLLVAPREVSQHVLAFWSENRNRQAAGIPAIPPSARDLAGTSRAVNWLVRPVSP